MYNKELFLVYYFILSIIHKMKKNYPLRSNRCQRVFYYLLLSTCYHEMRAVLYKILVYIAQLATKILLLQICGSFNNLSYFARFL